MTIGKMHPEIYRSIIIEARQWVKRYDSSRLERFWLRWFVGYTDRDVDYFRYLASLKLPEEQNDHVPIRRWD